MKWQAQSFNASEDHAVSPNNPYFSWLLTFGLPNELEFKEATGTPSSALYTALDRYMMDDIGRLKLKLHDKRNDFDFPVWISLFLVVNTNYICTSSACWACVSHLMCAYQISLVKYQSYRTNYHLNLTFARFYSLKL